MSDLIGAAIAGVDEVAVAKEVVTVSPFGSDGVNGLRCGGVRGSL